MNKNNIITALLLLINFLVWSIVVFVLGFIFLTSNVSAKSYRIRAYNINDVELFNTTTNTSPSASGLMTTSYVNMNNGNMTANNTTYFSFDITFGVRTCMTQLGVNECLMTFNVGELYWVDSGGSVHQINDICNITATRTKTFETSQNTILWQYRVVGSCAFSPNATLTGFLLKSYYTYQNTSFTGTSNKSAISLSNFDISQNPSEGQQIIDNANKNAQNIINAINNSNQEVITNQNENTTIINNSLNDINDTITDDTVDDQSSFFNNFDGGSYGNLTDIISLPLDFINSLNGTCQSINLPRLSFHGFNLDLSIPCMSSFVYNRFPSGIIDTLRLIINGFLLYRMLSWFIDFIQKLKNPNDDEIEVLDL